MCIFFVETQQIKSTFFGLEICFSKLHCFFSWIKVRIVCVCICLYQQLMYYSKRVFVSVLYYIVLKASSFCSDLSVVVLLKLHIMSGKKDKKRKY